MLQMLPEAKALGVHPNSLQKEVAAPDEVAQLLVGYCACTLLV